MLFDSAGEKNLEQLAAEGSFLERKTIARQLLGDRAAALPHVTGGEILQRSPHDAREIVTAVLIEFVVFHRDDGIDQIARDLVVGNRLSILDIDLAEDFVVPIEDDAGRFHLFELREIESRGLSVEGCGDIKGIAADREEDGEQKSDRYVKLRLGKPASMVILNRGPSDIGMRSSHAGRSG